MSGGFDDMELTGVPRDGDPGAVPVVGAIQLTEQQQAMVRAARLLGAQISLAATTLHAMEIREECTSPRRATGPVVEAWAGCVRAINKLRDEHYRMVTGRPYPKNESDLMVEADIERAEREGLCLSCLAGRLAISTQAMLMLGEAAIRYAVEQATKAEGGA